jgi:hypothetical protein
LSGENEAIVNFRNWRSRADGMISATLTLEHPQLYDPDKIWKRKKRKNRKKS